MATTDIPSGTVQNRSAPAQTAQQALNPTVLDRPSFVMSFPFSYSTSVASNAWMDGLDPEERVSDHFRAARQFLALYNYLAAEALVYLLPSPSSCGLPELTFTSSIGAVMAHADNTAVVSNFTSEPRRSETEMGAAFFESMGYRTLVSPSKFEGESDLRRLYDNVYVGGHGLRTQRKTFDWMERVLNAHIVKVHLGDPYLYHLDFVVFPATRESTLVCVSLLETSELRELEQLTEVVPVSLDDCYLGICNSVRLGDTLLNASSIHELKRGSDEYETELRKNRQLEDIAARLNLELNFFNLSEFAKSGARLSSLVMHLNYRSYE